MDGPELEVSGRRMGLSNGRRRPGRRRAPADRPCWLSFPPMTDRGLPIVDGAPACPFVAFEDDRDGRGQAPDHRHRCFAEPRPAPRALAHQEAYCLSSAFPVCPTFQDWARREAATARAAQRRAIDAAGRSRSRSASRCRRASASAYHAPGTDTPPPLPPRRNPPRDWADPPPWAGDADGEQAEPPSVPRRATARTVRSARRRGAPPRARHRAGWPAARPTGWPAATWTTADEPVAPSPAAYEAASYAAPVVSDPNERYRPAGRRRAAAAGIGRRVPGAPATPSAEAGRRALEPVGRDRAGQALAARRERAEAGRRAQAAAGSRRAVRAGLGGAAPVRGVPVAADPGRACPSFGRHLADRGRPRSRWSSRRVALFFVGPMLLGIGSEQPGRRRRRRRRPSRPRS